MSELVARKECIITVLNEAVLHGRTSMVVHAPFLDLDLVGINLEGRGMVDFVVSEAAYVRAASAVQGRLADPLDREVPGFGDFREAMHSSLLLPPSNMDELMKEIHAMEEKRRHPMRFPRQPCLAPDTNLAYKRLFSRLTLSGDTCGVKGYDPGRVQLLVADLVGMEISERVRRKYTPQELGLLRRAFRFPQGLDSMSNCLHKDGRRAMGALAELTAIRSKYSVWDVAGGTWTEDKEARDGEILRSLGRHAKEESMDVLFLSTDDKASAAAEAARVPILILRYPNEVPARVPFDPWLVPELIYDLALTFGVVSLKGLGLRLMGDWAGKTAEDFKAERVRLVMEPGSTLTNALEKDLRILERLRKEIELAGLR